MPEGLVSVDATISPRPSIARTTPPPTGCPSDVRIVPRTAHDRSWCPWCPVRVTVRSVTEVGD